MFHIHKWSKWKTVTAQFYYPLLNRSVIGQEQERTCIKCGLVQNKRV